MPFEKSPSLESFAQGIPPEPTDPERGHRIARTVIIGLMVMLGVLVVINLAQSRAVAIIGGYGTITGMVVDANGRPAVAEIIIERTDLVINSQPNGRFTVDGVPEGEHLLVVATANTGIEYPVVAVAGASVDIGTVQTPATTAIPVQ